MDVALFVDSHVAFQAAAIIIVLGLILVLCARRRRLAA
jgi:hypothetical protein